MRQVFITGGTGCIGSNLAATLSANGVHVRTFRRPSSDTRALDGIDVEYVPGDIREPASLRAAITGFDTVFHTAALVTFAAKERFRQMQVNVEGTRNVVHACLDAGVSRLVHVSSVATIGPTIGAEPADESTPYGWGETPGYKYSKYLAEQEVRKGIAKGLTAVFVNPTVVVGERDIHCHGSHFILAVKKGLVPLYIAGGMNVVYVGDVVRGMIAAGEKGRIGERYILGGHNMTHMDIFTRTAMIVGGRKPFARIPRLALLAVSGVLEAASSLFGTKPLLAFDLARQAGLFLYYSSAKAERELGYICSTFEEMVRAAYRWYKENGFI
jgi:dihydroflavonol-4-reductase